MSVEFLLWGATQAADPYHPFPFHRRSASIHAGHRFQDYHQTQSNTNSLSAPSPKSLPNEPLAVSPNNPVLSSCKGDYLQTDHVGCFVLISARYRINPQIMSSTTAPSSDRKKPAGWNFEPSGGLEMSRPISPPTSDPMIPRIVVRMNPICWAPGTMARAIRPTMNPTIIDQIMCNIVIPSRLWDRLRKPF